MNGSTKSSIADGSIRSASSSSSQGEYIPERERARINLEIEDVKKKLSELNENHQDKLDKFIANSSQVEKQKGLAPDNPQLIKVRTNFDKINKKHTLDVNVLTKRLDELQQNLDRIESGTFCQMDRKKGLTNSLKRNFREAITAPVELAHKLKASVGSGDDVSLHSDTKSEGKVGKSTFFTDPATDKEDVKLSDRQCNNFSQHFNMDTISSPLHTSTPLTKSNKKKSISEVSLRRIEPTEPLKMAAETSVVDDGFHPAPNIEKRPILQYDAELAQRVHNLEEHHMKLAKDVAREFSFYEAGLEEVRFKITKLEGLLNETIELHQAEFASLKKENAISTRIDFEHKDRFTDMAEEIGRMQNQLVKLENFVKDSISDRQEHFDQTTGFGTTMNLFVEFLKLVLFIFATILDLAKPFTSSKSGRITMVTLGLLALFGAYIPNIIALVVFLKERFSSNSTLPQ